MVSIWTPRLEGRAGPRYLAIAEALAEDIDEGRLPAGVRLPTHRALADVLGVTVGTVSRAYAEGARRGFLSGEVGRGTFVRNRHSDEELFRPRAEGLVDLSLNHPPVSLGGALRFALQDTLTDVARRDDPSLLAYPPEAGRPSHREAGAMWIRRVGLDVAPERIVIATGSQHAVTAVFATLLKPGDLVLSECLTYPGMKAAAALLHLRVLGLPIDEHGLQPDAFDAACRQGGSKALYCIPTIHNPTTGLMPESRRREIAAIATAHGVPIVEDDIHALLPEERPLPIVAFAPEIGYYVASTSKTLAPGLRVGYVLSPPGTAPRLAAAIRATAWASAPLMAEIAATWIRGGTADAILQERRREASSRQAVARSILSSADYESHPNAYHLWLRLPEPWRSESFTSEARRRGVSVTPSEVFVVGRTAAPHAVRVCLGAPSNHVELEKGLRLIAETLASSPAEGFPL
jgi:DNA-binding transcriptional MocR family regulator